MRSHRTRGALTRIIATVGVVGGLAVAIPVTASAAPSNPGFIQGPVRLLDTRIDLPNHPAGQIAGFTQVTLPDAVGNNDSALLSITVIDPTSDGYITVYPDGSAVPATSDTDFVTGVTSAESVLVKPGDGGNVDLLIGSSAPIDMIVDVMGTVPQASYTPFVPAQRILDTRTGPQPAPVTGAIALTLPTGVDGVPSDATAVAVTLTQADAHSGGFISAMPTATATGTSSLNYTDGSVASNLVWVKPSDGKIYLFVYGGATDVIVDLKGYAPSAASLGVQPQTRIVDSRTGQGGVTGAVTGAVSLTLPDDAPGTAQFVILNVTTTQSSAAGYVAGFQAASGELQTSNLNFTAGATVAGLVVAPITDGKASIYLGGGPTYLIADVEGYFLNP